ncbi:MAG: GntR family transcriptional regulator [Kiritimatiellales bacterium]
MAREIKYLEVYKRVKEQILAGEYRVGVRLPTEKELSGKYDVSIHTVRQAMAIFKTEGVIRKVAGSGTFVQAMPGEGAGQRASAKNIGVIVWERTRHMFPRMLPAIEEAIYSRGYHQIVCNTGKDPQRERDIIERLLEQGIRGFIVSPISWDEFCLEDYRRILDRNIPLVMVNRRAKGVKTTSIAVNNEEAGYLATRRVLQAGHRTIGHLTSSLLWAELVDARIRGYRRALEEFAVQFDERLIVFDKTTDSTKGFNGALELLSRPDRVTGVFCVNDEHVLGLFEAASKLNLSIPEHLSVVGFDQSMEVQSYLPFRLDTLRYPAEEIGTCAARELLSQMEDPFDPIIKTIELYPIPVFGNSCSKLDVG